MQIIFGTESLKKIAIFKEVFLLLVYIFLFPNNLILLLFLIAIISANRNLRKKIWNVEKWPALSSYSVGNTFLSFWRVTKSVPSLRRWKVDVFKAGSSGRRHARETCTKTVFQWWIKEHHTNNEERLIPWGWITEHSRLDLISIAACTNEC